MFQHNTKQSHLLIKTAAALYTFTAFVISSAFALAETNTAPQFEDIQKVREEVSLMLHKHYAGTVKNARIEVDVANLDQRLRLAKCAAPKTMKLNGHQKRTSNITVRVSCNGESPWGVFMPAKISVFQDVATITRDIYKGEILSASDIAIEERNTGNLSFGFAKNPTPLIGNAVTRNIAAGNVIRLSHISKPIAISRGDKITLNSSTKGLAVAATAISMSNGRVGDQIRVKNEQSNRIIEAFVIAPGQAAANL